MSRSKDAAIADAIKAIRDALDAVFDSGYRLGHEEALKRIVDLARANADAVSVRSAQGRGPHIAERSRRGRPRMPERDMRVREIFKSAKKALSINEILAQLQALGDAAPRSSVAVVLRRLEGEGVVARDADRNYVARAEPLPDVGDVTYKPKEEVGEAHPRPPTS